MALQASDPSDAYKCAGCGCTNERACPGGCYWVGPHKCSRCFDDRGVRLLEDPLSGPRQAALEAGIRFSIARRSSAIGVEEYERLRTADRLAREAYIDAIKRGWQGRSP